MYTPALLIASAIACGAPSLAAPPESATAGRLLALGQWDDTTGPHAQCVPPWQRAAIDAAEEAFLARHGPFTPGRGASRYAFYPQAATLDRDLLISGFVDLDPGPGALDYDCTQITYDTHAGIDSLLRSFAEQVIGVPVFAAADGVVLATDDGHPDMNTMAAGQPSNFVSIDHGGGRRTRYLHLRNGSVAVVPGQVVRAGDQIAMTASSGHSTWPHLHFETLVDDEPYEPFAGTCRPGESGWEDQPPLDRTFRIGDFGFSPVDLNTVPPPPVPLPRTGQLAFSERPHWFWIQGYNWPASSTWRVRYIRPDGTAGFTSAVTPFPNQSYARRGIRWWSFFINGMGTTEGVWRVQFEINGAVVLDAPVVVKAVRDPDFNRPPEAVQPVFDPPAPVQGDVLFARISPSLVFDDPDYDVVRYTYEWTVDGAPVRTVTVAGHADALPADTAPAGSLVGCTVIASDGSLSSAPGTASVTIGVACAADWNGDTLVNSNDISAYLTAWLDSVQNGNLIADFDGSNSVNSNDISAFLTAWLDAVQNGC